VAWLAILALIAQTAAQTPTLKTRTKEERESEFQGGNRITLNVQVTDDLGKPVTDLHAKDFTILDNHQPRKLAAFHAIDGEAMNYATQVIIVLDAVNSNPKALEAEKDGIFKYLAQSHASLPYPMSFALWSNGHLKSTIASRDRNTVGRGFVNVTKNVHSNACTPVVASAAKIDEGGSDGVGTKAADTANCLEVHFKDSVSALDSIAQQQLSEGGRTIIIWVGPGWPLLSDVEFRQLTPSARKAYFEELVTVLHDLRSAQVTLDALGPRDATREAELARVDVHALAAGTASPESAGPSCLALPIIAQQTGGQVMAASDDVAADMVKLLEDANWYYGLSFIPPLSANGVELRSLEVKVSRPGLKLRTMTEYYTEPSRDGGLWHGSTHQRGAWPGEHNVE
jgi:VWFA-related protein